MSQSSRCWCGNTDLTGFSPDYLRCAACETLVLARMPQPDVLAVSDDTQDFYGRQYYESCLVDRYGYPTLAERARLDLPERCLHWLRTTLDYKLPPGHALELGSAHGGFVAMLRWAGFDATGLELSPSLADFARHTFAVPTLPGRVEDQALEPSSLDLIAAMDVIEHLNDPLGTIKHCTSLLKPDGMFLFQTPQYREGKTLEQMVAEDDPFLMQLKPEQHLFLFSRNSLRKLFEAAGFPRVEFLPAVFAHYDMFVAACRTPLVPRAAGEITEALTATPGGRFIEALLHKDDRFRDAVQKLLASGADHAACEADRAARMGVIEEQARRLGQVEAERNCLSAELQDVRRHFETAEADRAARLQVIEEQDRRLGEVEAERNCLSAELQDLRRHFETAEADRAARLQIIEEQARRLGEAEAERNCLSAELQDLRRHFEAAEADRAARLAVIHEQSDRLAALAAERDRLRGEQRQAQEELAAWRERCAGLETRRAAIEHENDSQRLELGRLQARIEAYEQRIRTLSADLATRDLVLERIRETRLCRALNAVGLWKWLKEALARDSAGA